jgi:Mrp family chromosome partitioning ATPase
VSTSSPAGSGETARVSGEALAATAAPLTSAPAHSVTISQGPGETPWRPLLQVDRVVWPSIHARLQCMAASAIQQMADGLLSLCASGSKVLGLASCASGEGVTTLMLAAARSLANLGRKVAVVDANWNNPQLAQSLGLLPQIGWEETLCGGLPLEEVVIESLADGLAVLPVRKPSASTIAAGPIAASFDILAREFDVVLVDLGPLAQLEEGAPSRAVAARMDAVILVQNVRVTTPNRLADVREHLAASNLRYVGTIQNFVAG